MLKKYYLNLERSPERKKKFTNEWERFEAVDGASLPDNHPILTRMVSMWNISPKEHRGKCGCWMSHYNILSHIANNKQNNVIIVEDDAIQMREIPDTLLKSKNFTYLGGYFSHKKMMDGELKDNFPASIQGINILDRDTERILMTLSYYIPHWTIARDIVNYLDSRNRVRAIDVMLHNVIRVPQDYIYPAIFIEEDIPSTIHTKSRRKHPDIHYRLR